jgi:hypothetical protein
MSTPKLDKLDRRSHVETRMSTTPAGGLTGGS